MCRVLGITQFNLEQHRPIVERFCELAHTGMVMEEDPPGHEDGWGLAFYRDGELAVHKSGLSLLDERNTLYSILDEAQTSPVMILHLRKSAWADTSNTRHAHPFFRGNSVFFHNGVVYDYQGLVADKGLPGLPADARDTEVFFYHVMSGKAQDLGEKFLDSAATIKQKHRFSALNCLFSDGERLFAYRDYAKEEDYYSLYKARSGNSCLISSEPLDENMEWEMMAQEEFLAIELGDGGC
ncbi:MAG: class II glutamine amidotransferase [Anaerolineales bacterium]